LQNYSITSTEHITAICLCWLDSAAQYDATF